MKITDNIYYNNEEYLLETKMNSKIEFIRKTVVARPPSKLSTVSNSIPLSYNQRALSHDAPPVPTVSRFQF